MGIHFAFRVYTSLSPPVTEQVPGTWEIQKAILSCTSAVVYRAMQPKCRSGTLICSSARYYQASTRQTVRYARELTEHAKLRYCCH